jgi:LPXTG-motif cell wall-anchored protein
VDQVPAGAENLLTTAYPTLTGAQRRQVLAQTALPVSGNPLQSSSQGYYNMDLASAMSAKVTLDDKGNVVAVAAGQSAPSVVKAADTNNGNNGNSDTNGGNSNNGTGSNTGTDKGQAGANTATPKAGANDKAKASKQGKTASPLAKTGADVAMVAVAALIVLLAGGALILVSIRRRKQR